MTPTAFFIAGTDTGVGKTLVTCALLAKARETGLRVAGMKPIAAGCEATPEGLRNEDALALMADANVPLDYATVNPIALPAALSPHLAATRAGLEIDLATAILAFRRIRACADYVLVEGAGGWLAPLTQRLAMNDLARRLSLPVVLVVGLRLGCLNHAQLSARAVASDGLRLAGWIGSVIDPAMEALEENLETLRHRLTPPCLGVLPWSPGTAPAALARHLRLP